MDVTALFYKLYLETLLLQWQRNVSQFKSTHLITTKNNYFSDILFKLCNL